MLIEFMAEGLSFEAFAGHVRVHKDTLYNWEKLFPEFSEAKKLGFSRNLEFWERMGVNGAMGKIDKFNVTTWIFNMKNRHRWRDQQVTQHEFKMNDKLIIDLSGKSFDDISGASEADSIPQE